MMRCDPLTPYSLSNDVWIAWQFNRQDLGGGMVQAFRRADSQYETTRLKLRGLDPQATYELTDLDVPGASAARGGELMERGMPVSIKDQPGAVLIRYRRVEGR